MKQLREFRIYIAAFVVAIALLIHQIYRHNEQVQSAMKGKQDIFAQHKDAFDAWQSLTYSPIDTASEVIDQLGAATVVTKTEVTPQMHSLLLQDVASLIAIYQSSSPGPLYANYIETRHPVACDIPYVHLRSMAARQNLPDNSQPLQVLLATVSGNSPGKQFSGICGKASTITYSEANKNSSPYHCLTCTPADLDKSLPQRIGYISYRKWFEFPEDFNSQYDAGNTVKIADVTLFEKGQTSQVAERLLLRLVWCEHSNEWRPFELAKDVDDQHLTLFLP